MNHLQIQWDKCTAKEQQFWLLFFPHVTSAITAKEIFTDFLKKATSQLEIDFSEEWINAILDKAGARGWINPDWNGQPKISLSPLFSYFLKLKAQTIEPSQRANIRSAYIDVYNQFSYTYYNKLKNEDITIKQTALRGLVEEYSNIYNAFRLSMIEEKVAIHAYYGISYLLEYLHNIKWRLFFLLKAHQLFESIELENASGNAYKYLYSSYKHLSETYHKLPAYDLSDHYANLAMEQLKEGNLLEEYPSHEYVIKNLKARNYIRLGKLDNALSLFEEIKDFYKEQRVSELPGIYSNMGLCYQHKGQWEKATEYLIQAENTTTRSTTLANVCLNLGDCYIKMRNPGKADTYYHKYMKYINNTDYLQLGKGYHNLGNLSIECKDYNGAKTYFKQAIEFYHQSSLELMGRAYADWANLEMFQENFVDARTYLNRAIQILASNATDDLFYSLSFNSFWIDMGLEDFPEAKKACDFALKLAKGNPIRTIVNYLRLVLWYATQNQDGDAQYYCQMIFGMIVKGEVSENALKDMLSDIRRYEKYFDNKNYIVTLKQLIIQ